VATQALDAEREIGMHACSNWIALGFVEADWCEPNRYGLLRLAV
jgi:predicted NAD/FAD-dependent oxidoreductase